MARGHRRDNRRNGEHHTCKCPICGHVHVRHGKKADSQAVRDFKALFNNGGQDEHNRSNGDTQQAG